jgi:outer membrane autotransporter protein
MNKGIMAAAFLFVVTNLAFASSIESIQQDVAYAVINGGISANAAFDAVRANIDNLINLDPTDEQSVRLGYLSSEALAPSILPIIYSGVFDSLNAAFDSVSAHHLGAIDVHNVNVWSAGLTAASDFKFENRKFDKSLYGINLGADIALPNNLIFGIGYSYGKSDIDLKIADLSHNEIEVANALGISFANPVSADMSVSANMPFVYGKYNDSGVNVSFAMGYLMQEYQEKKNVAGENVKSDYSVNSLGFRALTGYDILLSTSEVKAVLTPEIGIDYISLKQGSFKDSIGNNVYEYSRDNLRGSIGLKLKLKFINKNFSIIPVIKFGAGYDIFNNNDKREFSLANGSKVSFDIVDMDGFDFNVGAEIGFIISENFLICLSSKAVNKQGYQSSLGAITISYMIR